MNVRQHTERFTAMLGAGKNRKKGAIIKNEDGCREGIVDKMVASQ